MIFYSIFIHVFSLCNGGMGDILFVIIFQQLKRIFVLCVSFRCCILEETKWTPSQIIFCKPLVVCCRQHFPRPALTDTPWGWVERAETPGWRRSRYRETRTLPWSSGQRPHIRPRPRAVRQLLLQSARPQLRRSPLLRSHLRTGSPRTGSGFLVRPECGGNRGEGWPHEQEEGRQRDLLKKVSQ